MKYLALYGAVFLLIIVQQIDSTVAFNCIKCDSATDPNCIADLSKVTGNEVCTTKCFTKKDSTTGAITRGCFATDAPCDAALGCQQCEIENCNTHKICQTCDSGADPDCATLGSTKPTNNQVCAAENTKCFINIKADKQTERGCATTEIETTCNANTALCKLCDAPNCNAEIFPANRICYQCSGSTCNEVDDTMAKACALYDADIKCYTIGTSATDMSRGCTTDSEAKCTATANTDCLLCAGAKCNNRKYERPQTLKCEQCNSKDTSTCVNAQNTEVAKLTDCKTELKYTEEDMCRTQTKDGVTYRGCYYDLVSLGECSTATGCKTCTTVGCNKDGETFTCIRCRTDSDPKCWNEADKMTGKTCDVGEGSADGCFTGTWDNVVIRGCVIDLDPQPKFVCTDDSNKQCTRCTTKDCNNKAAGAAALQLTSSLLLIALAAICKSL